MARNDSFQKKWAAVPSQFERPSDALIERGWAGGAAEDPPEAKWENWWHNRVDEALAEIEQAGALQWFPTVQYAIGATARSGGQNYIAALANTGIQPGSASDVGHWQSLSLLAATQAEAEAGTENTKRMTPLRVWQAITKRFSTQAQAEGGTDNTTTMTPLRVAQAIASRAVDTLNTQRINVASAAAVNLTTLAPNTRHINVTGTTPITSFTVASGRCYFVRFAAALTLTNGASLVTQTGANIVTSAGDTCILRATADNMVEVLCYSRPNLSGWSGEIVLSGTATDITGIPDDVVQIELGVYRMSLSGSASPVLVLGTASGFATAGYSGGGNSSGGSSAATANVLLVRASAAADLYSGGVRLTRISATKWSIFSVISDQGGSMRNAGSSVDLGSALTQLRITSEGGTNTFDSGSISITYQRAS